MADELIVGIRLLAAPVGHEQPSATTDGSTHKRWNVEKLQIDSFIGKAGKR